MTELVVRRLLIDLETPLPRHWCGGDAFRTALFNAMSMSFPVGEQYFIDSVRDGVREMPADTQAQYRSEVQGFIGQEATHRRIHSLFNDHLEKQGLVNHWAPRIVRNMKYFDGVDVRHRVAVTAANEHFTAVLAEWMLTHNDLMGDCEPRLKTMWLWHSAEELEHKSTAFNIYRALGGSESWRLTWFRRVTFFFLTDLLRQTVSNLRQDGTLWRWRTWTSAASYLFGQRGLIRHNYRAWKAYFRADFHPDQQATPSSENWLKDNAAQYTRVGA